MAEPEKTCPKDGVPLEPIDPPKYDANLRCPSCGTAYSDTPYPVPFFPELR